MKTLFFILLFTSCFTRTFGQNNIRRDPNPRKDVANVFFKSSFTLFDLWSDEPIFPNADGLYNIYYATNEDKTPRQITASARDLEAMTVYKFKNYSNCYNWCNGIIFNTSTSQTINNTATNKQFSTITSAHDESNCIVAKNKYLAQNPDVAKNGADAWLHYRLYGNKEGRIWPNCNTSNDGQFVTKDGVNTSASNQIKSQGFANNPTNSTSSTTVFDHEKHVYIEYLNKSDAPKYINGFAKIGRLALPDETPINIQHPHDYRFGFINENGAIVISPNYYETEDFSEGLVAVCKIFPDKTMKWGFVNTTGKVVIPFIYTYCQSFSEGLAAVRNSKGMYGFINKSGNTIIPFIYKNVISGGFENGKVRVTKNRFIESELTLNKQGKVLSAKGENEFANNLVKGSSTKNNELAKALAIDFMTKAVKDYNNNSKGYEFGGSNSRTPSNSRSTPSKSNSSSSTSNKSSKHTFTVTITWNIPKCGSCPFPRPSAQNGIVDYFYERSGSYTIKPVCPTCGKKQYNTISGFTENIGVGSQGSKKVTVNCN